MPPVLHNFVIAVVELLVCAFGDEAIEPLAQSILTR